MEPKVTKLGNFSITYYNEEEIKILEKEIFHNEIYSVSLSNKTNPTIFDIGSNIGISTLFFKKQYPLSSIFCFEPNPNTFPLLEENLLLNGLTDVKTFKVALGRKETCKELYIDSSGEGAFSTASFTKDAWNGKQKTIPISVKVEPLSKYVKNKIDLMKMDVEGAEIGILKDLDCKKKLSYIENLIVEYHPNKKHRIEEVTNILERNSYTLSFKEEGKSIPKAKEALLLVIAQKCL